MTRKQTDASSILGAARRAADVQRPKIEETLPQPPEANSPKQTEKRVNVALKMQTHKRLKLLSVQRDMTVQDLAEQLLNEILDSQEA